MPLLPNSVERNLKDKSFIDEFNQYAAEYLNVVMIASNSAKDTLRIANIPVPSPDEDFAEKFLLASVAFTFLSGKFPFFRQALSARPYIDIWQEIIWARSLARYVLHEAIRRGVL